MWANGNGGFVVYYAGGVSEFCHPGSHVPSRNVTFVGLRNPTILIEMPSGLGDGYYSPSVEDFPINKVYCGDDFLETNLEWKE